MVHFLFYSWDLVFLSPVPQNTPRVPNTEGLREPPRGLRWYCVLLGCAVESERERLHPCEAAPSLASSVPGAALTRRVVVPGQDAHAARLEAPDQRGGGSRRGHNPGPDGPGSEEAPAPHCAQRREHGAGREGVAVRQGRGQLLVRLQPVGGQVLVLVRLQPVSSQLEVRLAVAALTLGLPLGMMGVRRVARGRVGLGALVS